MKTFIEKVTKIIQVIFGYGVMLALFVGGFSALGYLAAIIIGGDTAVQICNFIYKTLYPVLVNFSTGLIFLGLIKMYLSRDNSFGLSKKKKEAAKEPVKE